METQEEKIERMNSNLRKMLEEENQRHEDMVNQIKWAIEYNEAVLASLEDN